MSYSDDSDLLAELSPEELAKLTGDNSGLAIDTDRTAQARQVADSIIEATIRGRYDLPLTSGPDLILKSISLDLTVYYLNEYRYRDTIVPPGAIRRRDNALDLLAKIAEGLLLLDGYTGGATAPPAIISNHNQKERYFDDDSMDTFFKG